jgi:hypothetical protein
LRRRRRLPKRKNKYKKRPTTETRKSSFETFTQSDE